MWEKKEFVVYRVRRTVADWPWRWFLYEDNNVVGLTFTKWGAKRLARRMKKVGYNYMIVE